ncbi:MAG: leucine-rich repeat protein [Prevotella sp.]|nr:leucine-rich repeat protein [Prevotella sp.]
MKRLLTLFAFLALFLGANAQGSWNQVYTIDYSTYRGFPFYVMGYVPEFDNGCMTDYGAMYGYKTDDEMADFTGGTEIGTVTTQGGVVYHKVQLDEPAWHQYFLADGIPTKIDGKYKVVAKVKASADCSINVNMGWGWGSGEQTSTSVYLPNDLVEVEWEYSGIGGSNCNLVAQPGGCTETIEWQSITVYEWQRESQKPIEWLEDITNGDAETTWQDLGLADIKYNDMDNNYKICAWARTKGRNLGNDDFSYLDGGDNWNPFPADIETVDGNNVFVVHAAIADTEGDASAWDNQFWIQSKHAWKAGTNLKIKFRYKCDYAGGDVTTNTQIHKQAPMDYLIWHAIGDITFTNDWKTFDGTMSIGDDMAGGWSIAFNLNSEVKDAVNFYFDDLSWQYMKLDEGYFLAGINKNVTDSYDDLANAIEFMYEDWAYVATIGEKGNSDSYVDQLMISTTRGDDAAFKGATLKPYGTIKNDPEDWLEYVPSINAKLDVPGLGVWKVYLDPEYTSMAFEMLEGIPYEEKQPIDIFTNTTDIVINAPEREDLMDTYSDSGITVREEMDDPAGVEVGGEGHEGQTWDNQFFIKANRALAKGEVTKLVFKYKSSIAEAKTSTMCFAEEPGVYMHWAAIGDVTFTDEWQLFEKEFIVPDAADGMWSIGFNMAEIKDACDYYIKDVQWYLYDESLDEWQTYENLINAGPDNFWVKTGAGSDPYIYNKEQENIVWTIAGSSESIFGTAWDPSNTNNDMSEIKPGVFMLTKRNVRLEAGEVIEYKVVGNHSWDINYGENGEPDGWNMTFSVGQTDFYDLYFYFYRNSGNILSCTYQYASSGIEPNPTEIVVYAMERDDLSDNETDGIREEEGGTGEVWDNQFWIVANRNLAAGETAVLEFDYMSSDYATTRTEFHDGPTEYLHWDALGEINFTPYWQHYRTVFTVPSEADNMKSIAFDMAVVKEARDYHIKNVVWNVYNSQESLINQEGSENFYVRIGANTEPYMYNGDSQENLFALLTAQIQTSNAALEKLNYANVPGAADLRTLIEAAQAITIESDVDTIRNSFTQLRSLTMSVVNMDTQYKALEDLMVRIETVIQNNPDADATLAAEAINKMIEVRAALNSGAYNQEELWRMTSIMNDYYYALSKVYLTINVTTPGTLRSLINEKGFDASSIVGLTVSGTLDYDDINFIQNMYELEMLNIKETNITEIWSWMFSGRNLNKVVLPKNLQRLGEYAFAWNYNLTEVELPGTLQEISYEVFYGCENLKSITYNTIMPVSLYDYLMEEYYAQQCTLYVPSIAVSAFQSNYYWNMFRIVGTDMMPEDIFIARAITLDWPEGLGTSVKPNVTIGYSEYNGTIGSLTLNGNSTVSMSNFNMLWSPRRSSWSVTYNDQTGTYEWYRYQYSSLVANAPMRADNVSVSLETNTYRWDFLTFPFDVKVSDIINQQQTNAPLVIRRYDGKNRADGKMGETWVDMTPDMTLEAGKGYIWQSAEGDQGNSENNFTVTALDNAKKNNLFTTADVTVQLDEFISEFSQNRSWNLIGNPYPAFYDIRGMQTTAPITIWNGYNNVYQAYVPGEDDYILNPGQAFFIQRPLDQETLTFIKEGRQADLGIRNWDTNSTRAAENKEHYVFNLILSGSEDVQGDRTRIVFDATAKADYEAGRDASKFMSPEATAAQIFTTNGDVRYAINVRPAMDGIVELGLSIGTAGSYTIALNTNVENEVYLIDRLTGMETRIDGGSTYTFQATKGISEGRFAVRFGNGEVTGIKAIASDSKDSENWYNLKGQRVNAPTKGLYIQNGKKTVVK